MPEEHHGPGHYDLRIGGHLGSCWAGWSEGLVPTPESDGTTTLCGPVADQAALHGLLAKVRNLGATLIALTLLGAPGSRGGTGVPGRARRRCARCQHAGDPPRDAPAAH